MPPASDPASDPARVSSSDGVTLAVHDLGPDLEGAPAVLAHATGFHGRIWLPVARRLSGFRTWAPDLRGHGDSPAPAGFDFDWEGFADDVLAVVDGLGLHDMPLDEMPLDGDGRLSGPGIHPPVGIGHSKGGSALLMAEARRPGTFTSLWVYEPVVFPPGHDPGPGADAGRGNHLADGARARRDRFASFAAAEANFGSKPPMQHFDPEALHEYVQHGFRANGEDGVTLKCRPADEARIYEMGGQHEAWNRLGAVTCPVTVVRGGLTSPEPGAMAEAVVERLPAGRLEPHDDLDHFGPMVAPERMAASILAAVARRG